MQQTEQRSLSYWLLVPSILSNLSHLYTCTAYVSGMDVTLPPDLPLTADRQPQVLR